MNPTHADSTGQYLGKAKLGLWTLLAFTVLITLMEWLITNRTAMLYLYFLPVVLAALMLRLSDALWVAGVACAIVLTYVAFGTGQLDYPMKSVLLWTQLGIWAGTLVLTACLVSTFRTRMIEAVRHRQQAYTGVVDVLSRLIRTGDAAAAAHAARVSEWAARIGQALGLGEPRLEELRLAGLLHDAGRIEVTVDLLRHAAGRAGPQADADSRLRTMMEHIADAIETRHEQFNGMGPRRLRGEEIPLVARIVAVADAFDTLVADPPYGKGLPVAEALDTVRPCGAIQFDPTVVATLESILDDEGDLCAAGVAEEFAAVP